MYDVFSTGEAKRVFPDDMTLECPLLTGLLREGEYDRNGEKWSNTFTFLKWTEKASIKHDNQLLTKLYNFSFLPH